MTGSAGRSRFDTRHPSRPAIASSEPGEGRPRQSRPEQGHRADRGRDIDSPVRPKTGKSFVPEALRRGAFQALWPFLLLLAIDCLVVALVVVSGTSLSPGRIVQTALSYGWSLMCLGIGASVEIGSIRAGVPAILFLLFDLALVRGFLTLQSRNSGWSVSTRGAEDHPAWDFARIGVERRQRGKVSVAVGMEMLKDGIGLLVWTLLFAFVPVVLGRVVPSFPAITARGVGALIWRAAVVYCLAALIGWWPRIRSSIRTWLVSPSASGWGRPAERVLETSWAVARDTFLFLLLETLVIVIIWAVRGASGIGQVARLVGLEGESLELTRVILLLLSLGWLPDFQAWALVWLSGGAFRIGSIGTFSMTSAQASHLPLIPVLGALPAAVGSSRARAFLLALPFLTGLVCALVRLAVPSLSPSGRGILIGNDFRLDGYVFRWRRIVRDLGALPLLVSLLSSVLLTLFVWVWMSLSSGPLGTGNLAHVGIDVGTDARRVIQQVMRAYMSAWLALVVIDALWLATAFLVHRFGHGVRGDSSGEAQAEQRNEVSTDEDDAEQTRGRTRTVRLGNDADDSVLGADDTGAYGHRRERSEDE